MDPNRPETGSNQQQNVHLHMHHVCNCQGGIYPAYYPAVGYRTPIPSLVPYHTPSVARPYLQHYQYTQFNVGSQYTVPLGHVTGSSTSVYGPNTSSSSTIDLVYGSATIKEHRDREEGSGDKERSTDPPEGYDYGQVTPPANELLVPVKDLSESTTQENFVKFLERSCLTAEQIAYRNRNRPCFRNIQNLCIRTRSEILKPCTTISNIHSQGIPWATKDFIYAFVRLTNCWHILKGYWDNRDGSSLGKIEKELTPDFRACYVRWEKETMELAGQLTKIFYNLDTNLNSSSSAGNVYTLNNLIPPQVNLMKNTSENTLKKQTTTSDATATSLTNSNSNATSKNVRGIIHLPANGSPTVTETADQANQTYSGDFNKKEEEYDSEEERTRRVYMKPGSYNVPKKGLETVASINSPRAIEFLDTAQNVNKVKDAANERYWANIFLSARNKLSQDYKNMAEEDDEKNVASLLDNEVNVPSSVDVQEWLVNSNFADFLEPHSSSSLNDLKGYYSVDNAYNNILSQIGTSSALSMLQRNKTHSQQYNLSDVKQSSNGVIELGTLRNIPKPRGVASIVIPNEISRRGPNPYELKGGGLTEIAQCILDKMVNDMKGQVLGPAAGDGQLELDKIQARIRNLEYTYVNEVIRDLRYFIKLWDEMDIQNAGWLSQKLKLLLLEHFNSYDFSDIKGELNESVGPLKNCIQSIFNNDCDQFM